MQSIFPFIYFHTLQNGSTKLVKMDLRSQTEFTDDSRDGVFGIQGLPVPLFGRNLQAELRDPVPSDQQEIK